jgi:anthranilate/para-aminobenzoate synthase component I
VSEVGSVKVSSLFQVETYPTLYTLTSTVTARLRPGVELHDVLAATFPCGSVVGAPKHRVMKIIRQIEQGPRGVYTGSIGANAPKAPSNSMSQSAR